MQGEDGVSLFPLTSHEKVKRDRDKSEKDVYSLYKKYCAKRNSVRLQQGFTNHRIKLVYVLTSLLLFVLMATIIITCYAVMIQVNTSYIEEKTGQLLVSVQTRIGKSIRSILKEPEDLTRVMASLFNEPSIVPLEPDNYNTISRMLVRNYQVLNTDVTRFDIGRSTGELIRLEREPKLTNLRLYYTKTPSSTVSDYLYKWDTDSDGKNMSFPFYDGDALYLYNIFRAQFYKTGSVAKRTVWTPLFSMSNQNISEVMMAVTTPYRVNSSTNVFAESIHLTLLHDLLYQLQPTANSRLMLLDDQNGVLALSANDSTYDIFETNIIQKTMLTVNDPLIECARKTPYWHTQSPYIFSCTINKATKRYRYGFHGFNVAGGVTWYLICNLCVNDYTSIFNIATETSTVISIILLIVFLAITLTVLFIIRSCLYSAQSRIYKQKNKFQYQAESASMIDAMFALTKCYKIYEFKTHISEKLNDIIKDLRRPNSPFFYDRSLFLKSIKNDKIRKIIDREYRFPTSDNTGMFIIQSTLEDLTGKRVSDQFTRRSQIGLESEPIRRIVTNMRRDELLKIIADTFKTSNYKAMLFDEDLLQKTVIELAEGMDETSLMLAADSFELVNYILSVIFSSVEHTGDEPLAMLAALLAAHMTFHVRKTLPKIESRYFVSGTPSISNEVIEIVKALYQCRDEHVIKDNGRWQAFAQATFVFTYLQTYEEHMRALNLIETLMFTHSSAVPATHGEAKYFYAIIGNLARISFLLHSIRDRTPFSAAINPEVNHEVLAFEERVIKSFVTPSVNALRFIIEPSKFGLEKI